MINFFPDEHKEISRKKFFGICDTPPPPHKKAYIDESNKQDWIATVENPDSTAVTFIPIDHCIDIRRSDGTMDNRCDGLLYYDKTIIFVELKQSEQERTTWISKGEKQLRATIIHFEKTPEAKIFTEKKAYVANNLKPFFRTSQTQRMDKFLSDTGYVLRIESEIKLAKS